jgi:hypothetical protein
MANANIQTANPGYILTCSGCQNVFRCESIRFPLAGLPKHCPYCGLEDNIKRSIDSAKDYWYAIAEGIGLPKSKQGADIALEIFDSWIPSEYPKFADYVKALRDGTYDA